MACRFVSTVRSQEDNTNKREKGGKERRRRKKEKRNEKGRNPKPTQQAAFPNLARLSSQNFANFVEIHHLKHRTRQFFFIGYVTRWKTLFRPSQTELNELTISQNFISLAFSKKLKKLRCNFVVLLLFSSHWLRLTSFVRTASYGGDALCV